MTFFFCIDLKVSYIYIYIYILSYHTSYYLMTSLTNPIKENKASHSLWLYNIRLYILQFTCTTNVAKTCIARKIWGAITLNLATPKRKERKDYKAPSRFITSKLTWERRDFLKVPLFIMIYISLPITKNLGFSSKHTKSWTI